MIQFIQIYLSLIVKQAILYN